MFAQQISVITTYVQAQGDQMAQCQLRAVPNMWLHVV